MREDRVEEIPKDVVTAMRATLTEAVKLAHTTKPPDPGFRHGLGILAPRLSGYVIEALIGREAEDAVSYVVVRASPLGKGQWGFVYQDIEYTGAELNAIDAVRLSALRNDRVILDRKIEEIGARMASRASGAP